MKKTYPSRYSPRGKVHAAQYITELICEKKARQDGKELPIKFWELKEWNKYYRYQIMLANKLLKKYRANAIIGALKDKRTWKTYSLRGGWLEKIIKEYNDKPETPVKDVKYDIPKGQTFRKNNGGNSIISKLKDLE